MVDKNLFLYDLAVVAIFKDEGHYLKEWLDYHLLAGVEHFYLYNNDSSDDCKKILAPYVEKNLVTLTDFPGKMMQSPAYEDALEKFRFDCRYMVFIDLDEFIFPKTNQKISEVVDEILSDVPNAAGLGINWQIFGSNGQEKADYSRGVLERFTRRAPSDWLHENKNDILHGNFFIKSVVNPRYTDSFPNPHYGIYFDGMSLINSNGQIITHAGILNIVATDKIVLNHYYTKSYEEFISKVNRGSAYSGNDKKMEVFSIYDRNEIFDDGILKYRAAREKIFSFESDEHRINRVINSVFNLLTERSPFDAPEKFFNGNLETFLTCRAAAEKFQIKIGERSAEEVALAWIYQLLMKCNSLDYADAQLLFDVAGEIISRPFPLAKKILKLFSVRTLPVMIDVAKNSKAWSDYKNYRNWKRLLDSI